jgi:hypothetical protein
VESLEQFVSRTQGPLIPYVDSWYPWVYAHHYLRAEAEQLPAELGVPRSVRSLSAARELVHLWCALTGESIDQGARTLADAYLERWGIHHTEQAAGPPEPDRSEAGPVLRRQRTARTRAAQARHGVTAAVRRWERRNQQLQRRNVLISRGAADL